MRMSKLSYVAFVISLIAAFATNCIAQNLASQIEAVRLESGEAAANIIIWEESLDAFPDGGWEFFSQRGVIKSQEGEEPLLSFIVTYGYFSDFGELAQAWNALQYNEHPRPILEENTFSDFAEGSNAGYVRFIKDCMIVSISFGRSRDIQKLTATDENFYFQLVRDKIVQKIEAQNFPSLPAFAVNFSQSGDAYPFTLTGKIQTEFEYEIKATAVNADTKERLEFSPEIHGNEFLLRVEDFSPGTYSLIVWVQDSLGRESRLLNSFEVREHSVSSEFSKADTIISERFEHRNDGACVLLTLEKIQGKAARNAVAFELADLNLSGLSRATLVLTTDPSQAVTGWGNGRTISAQAITTPWQEGNGWSFGLKKKDQIAGNGSGATWFSPADEDISNDSPDSVTNWNGATSSINPSTAPSVQIANFQSGEVAFDVTTDVLNGAEHGWLILKDQENVGSKVSFYSREGAAAAGNPDLAPRLNLEFGDPVASGASPSDGFLAKAGLGSISTRFRATQSGGELRSVREVLQENPVAALATEQLLTKPPEPTLC